MAHQETPHPETQLDAWHQHTADEGVPQAEHASHINIGVMLIVFVAMVVSISVMVAGLYLFFKSSSAQIQATRLENTVQWSEEYIPYREAALENISGFRPIDAEAGTVQVPVELGIDAVIQKYQSP